MKLKFFCKNYGLFYNSLRHSFFVKTTVFFTGKNYSVFLQGKTTVFFYRGKTTVFFYREKLQCFFTGKKLRSFLHYKARVFLLKLVVTTSSKKCVKMNRLTNGMNR